MSAVAAMPAPGGSAAWRPLIDPAKVISGIVSSKLLIASMTIAAALLGAVVALSTPKKYESVAEMLVDPRDLRLTDREITTTGLASDATLAIVENQVRVLTSGTVLNKVVDELNLTGDPEFNGQSDNGFLNVLANWRALFQRGGGDDGGARKRAITIDNLARSLNVERGGKTFVVSVGVTTQSPDKSALIANTMTRVFLETYGKFQSNTAGRAADELNSRLDEQRREVEEAERKVETFKAEKDLIGSQGRLISEDELVTLNSQLSVARARTLELSAKASSARAVTAEAALSGALPEELTSNVMTELRSQYAALKSESDRLSARLGPRHPQRQSIDAQLDGARGQIESELRRIVASIQVELKRAVQFEQELASRLAQLKVGQGSVNADLVTLRELEREASAKRAVYESFLLRAKETGEQRDINTANISVISQAFPPIVSVGPSRVVTVLTFMIAGFLGGVGIGGARGAWRSLRDDARARWEDGAPGAGHRAADPTDGGPEDGPRGGRPERMAGDAFPGDRTSERPSGVPISAKRDSALQGEEAAGAGPSSWLGAFRRTLRRDEAAAAPVAVPSAEETRAHAVAGAGPAGAAQTPPMAWNPLAAAPGTQPMQVWQSTGALSSTPSQAPAHTHPFQACSQAAPGYLHMMPAFQQGMPAFAAPVPSPAAIVAYTQQLAPYPPVAPGAQLMAFSPQPVHAAFVAAQPFAPAAVSAFAGQQPVAGTAGHPLQPGYPHVADAGPSRAPAPAAASHRDVDHDHGRFASRERGTGAKTVDELRHDLREFREAVLDLAADRARRRYG